MQAVHSSNICRDCREAAKRSTRHVQQVKPTSDHAQIPPQQLAERSGHLTATQATCGSGTQQPSDLPLLTLSNQLCRQRLLKNRAVLGNQNSFSNTSCS